MKPQDFLQTAEQLKLLSEYIGTAITGKGKADKINTANQYIESIAKAVLKTYIESSCVLVYKQDGRECIDIIYKDGDPDHLRYYLGCYGYFINISWDDFQRKYKNILDFSRYKPTKNHDIVTYCDN